MIFGMSEALYTALHVIVSLLGIGTGVVVALGLIRGKVLNGWTGAFLTTTILTSVSGFGFPAHQLLPSHILGILSLIALTVAVLARYRFHLRNGWRKAYVIAALVSLYFNVFVAVVQAFLKTPALHAIAPTQKEPPFAGAQLVVLLTFVALGVLSVRKHRELPA